MITVLLSGPYAHEEIVSGSLSMSKLHKFHMLVFVSEESCFVRCSCTFSLCRWHLSNSYWAWLLAGCRLNLINACAAIMTTLSLWVLVCEFFQDIAMRIGCWWYKSSWHCLFLVQKPSQSTQGLLWASSCITSSSGLPPIIFVLELGTFPKEKTRNYCQASIRPQNWRLACREQSGVVHWQSLAAQIWGQGLPPHSDLL